MYQLNQVPPAIEVDYGIACQFPDSVFKDSVPMAEKRWDMALILAIAYASSAGNTIPMTPAKSLHYFQLATQLARKLDDNTYRIAVGAISSVFDEVMNDNQQGLRGYFQRAILNDMRLSPEAAHRLGVRDIGAIDAESSAFVTQPFRS